MKARTPLILAIIVLVALAIGCSGSQAPANCPEMGTLTSVDDPSSRLNMDNLAGSTAPNFTWEAIDCKSLETITGKKTSLNDLAGKPVMIIFHISMNCPGCKAQMPYVLAAYEQRTNKNLIVLTVYRGDKASRVRDYVTSLGWNFPALADPDDMLGSKYNLFVSAKRCAPISIFIDTTGVIKGCKIGPFKSQEEIKAILDSL